MNTSVIEPRHSHKQSIDHDFHEHFVVEGKFLTSDKGSKVYSPQQIEIISYFRLNEERTPNKKGMVYLIRTYDGRKGMLIYQFDVFTDSKVYSFLKEYVAYKNRQFKAQSEA